MIATLSIVGVCDMLRHIVDATPCIVSTTRFAAGGYANLLLHDVEATPFNVLHCCAWWARRRPLCRMA
jgi:hypothetical protein